MIRTRSGSQIDGSKVLRTADPCGFPEYRIMECGGSIRNPRDSLILVHDVLQPVNKEHYRIYLKSIVNDIVQIESIAILNKFDLSTKENCKYIGLVIQMIIMDTKKIAVAVVGLLIIIGVGGTLLLSGDESTEKRIDGKDVALVYGNANNDYAIDHLDVEILQDIVDEKITWDSENNPLADANFDGKITQADIDLVKKIINNEKCDVYYHNCFDEAQEISYPLKDKRIAVTYWQQAEEAAILGLWDNVVLANASVDNRSNLYDYSNVQFYGNAATSKVDAATVERMLEEDIELVICSGYQNLYDVFSPLKNKGIEAIYLWHAGEMAFSTILTTGILTDTEEQAEKFLKYKVDVEKYITDKMDGVDKPSLVITMIHYGKEDAMISKYGGIFTSVNDPAQEWHLLKMLADVETQDINATGSKTQGRNYLPVEWFIENPRDYILVMGSGANKVSSQDLFDQWFEEDSKKYFGMTEAYKNGNMVGTTFSLGGFSAYSLMPIMAWMVHPDLFTQDEGEELRQYYLDNFTDKKPAFNTLFEYYVGDGYDASYLD